MINKNIVLGGVAGGLIGVAAALLLAPKAGVDLIQDLAHSLPDQGERRRSTSRRSISARTLVRKSIARKRKGVRSAKGRTTHHGGVHVEESKAHKLVAKKKRSPARVVGQERH